MPDSQNRTEAKIPNSREEFSEFVRQHQNRVFAFLMRMTGNRETALDLTQDTFVAAYEHRAAFRGESAASTWLFQIASNKAKNLLKKLQRETPLDDQLESAPTASDPEGELQQKELVSKVREKLPRLPEKQREAFVLRFYEQMKFNDIARIQGCSVSAAKTNYAEALKKLRRHLLTT
jgi:RNA polymerase sigma-70 factor (ECF subfamily)